MQVLSLIASPSPAGSEVPPSVQHRKPFRSSRVKALEMYTAFTSLSESRPPIAKLGAVGSGGHSIAGLMEVREAHLSGRCCEQPMVLETKPF